MLNLFKIFGENVKMSKVVYSQRWEWQTIGRFSKFCEHSVKRKNYCLSVASLVFRFTIGGRAK